MKRFIKFPDIAQFRTIIKNVQHQAAYIGYNEEKQKSIYNRAPTYPTITAVGTEKIHGTNAGVCYSHPDGFWVQSRTSIIEAAVNDNAACAFHADMNKDAWMSIITGLAEEYDVDLNENIITVYFEWCGAGIQKKTAVEGLEKMAIIFRHFKVAPIEPNDGGIPSKWHETIIQDDWVDDAEHRIFNISTFPTYEIEIDFNNPLMSQNKMVDLVENTIEPSSPVGETFGIKGNVGEGMVVSFLYKGTMHQFKVKGEKHSKSKVKKLKKVDDVKLQKIQDIAQQVTPAWRLEQMFDLANDVLNGGEPLIENMDAYLRLVNTDIIKEDSDIIADAELIPKDVFPTSSRIARQFYQQRLDEIKVEIKRLN